MSREALGLIETRGMLGAIEVTRAATQAAEVSIASAEHTESGRVIVKIEGSWSAVAAAVDAGARAAEQTGELVSMHIVPRPDELVSPLLPYRLFIDRYQPEVELQRNKTSRAASGAGPKAPRKSTPSTSSIPKAPPSTKTAKSSASKQSRSKPLRVSTPPAASNAPVDSRPPVISTPLAAPIALLSMAELEAMPVVKLRQYARSLPNLPIQGRQISMANKQQLLEAIRAIS